jgi:ribonuclease D
MHGIDVETTALAPDEGDLRLLQISDGKKARVYDAFQQSEDTLRRAVEREDELVAHNATFEREWIDAKLGLDMGVLHDTMIMSRVLYTGTNPGRRRQFSHSLASAVQRELKRELSKDEQDSYWGALGLRRDQVTYAALDAAVLPELAEKLLRKIDDAGLRDVYELELRVSHAVDAMQKNGFAVTRRS